MALNNRKEQKMARISKKTEELDRQINQYIELKSGKKGSFDEYDKAAYINGFLDGIDILTGNHVDTYYHGLMAAREILTGKKPTVHYR